MIYIRAVSFGVLVLIQALMMYVLDDVYNDVATLQHKLAYAEQEIYALNVDLAETIEQVITNQRGN